jgi:hypothetical protein
MTPGQILQPPPQTKIDLKNYLISVAVRQNRIKGEIPQASFSIGPNFLIP